MRIIIMKISSKNMFLIVHLSELVEDVGLLIRITNWVYNVKLIGKQMWGSSD